MPKTESESASLGEHPFVAKFQEFFNRVVRKEIDRLAESYPDKKSLNVDFKDLEKFDYELADELLENPDIVLDAASQAIQLINVPTLREDSFSPHIRIFSLPDDRKPLLRDIGASHLEKLLAVEGIIKQITDVLPKLKLAAWKCKYCGNTYRIEQRKSELAQPSMCECRHRDFQLLVEESEFINYQKIGIQEPLELLRGNEQPTDMSVFLSDDLVNQVSAGDKVKITGMLRLSQGKKGLVFGRQIEALHVEETEKEFEELEITPEAEEEIKVLAKDPNIYNKLIQSIATNIYGHEVVKEAIAMQLFGGVKKALPGQQTIRGNLHILLVGDPGTGKSMMLLSANEIAPRSIYVGGKSASGAGISATAVKDDFGEGGWTIKAGALVLASGGLAALDELDKMDAQDRSALHESLEQQSYHKDFEIMLANGSKQSIGSLVDSLISANKNSIIYGKDCEILPVNHLNVLTTDFNKVFPIPVNRVSRHKAPEKFVKVTYSNNRSIMVTPEHPVFVFQENQFKELPAEQLKIGMMAPGVRHVPVLKETQSLFTKVISQGRKNIDLPSVLDPKLGAFLGYQASEGHSYYAPDNSYAEIGISNTGPVILAHMGDVFQHSFNTYINQNIHLAQNRAKATKDLTNLRCSSLPLYEYFTNNFSEMAHKAPLKRLPGKILSSPNEVQEEFLKAAFSGDGFVDSERFGYATSSIKMAEDYQDMLLQFGVICRIQTENRNGKKYHKVVVSGTDSMLKFLQFIPKRDHRRSVIDAFIVRSSNKTNQQDCLPTEIIAELEDLLRSFRLSTGYFHQALYRKYNAERKTIGQYLSKVEKKLYSLENFYEKNPRKIRKLFVLSLNEVAKAAGMSSSMITYIERNPTTKNATVLSQTVRLLAQTKLEKTKKKALQIRRLIDSDIRFLSISKVEFVENIDSEWVYDVTVEPTQTFVSSGLVLHNTISVAKAGIMTRFKTETSLLAAANPKFSRFDPYASVLEQIDLPASLISRFDLFFTIRDVLDKTKDTEISQYILKTHQAGERLLQMEKQGKELKQKELADIKSMATPALAPELLKQYVSYARQNVFPTLNSEAIKKLSDFYVGLREMGKEEGNYAATHRQLEGLIRLSEASARVRLSDVVGIEDAERAVRLFKTSMEQTVVDPTTGKIDIDIIATGQSHSQLEQLKKVLQIIKDKARELDNVPVDLILDEAQQIGIDKEKTREIMKRLEKKGEIYRPRYNLVKPTQFQ